MFSPNHVAPGCADDDGKSVNWFIFSVSFSQRSKSFLGQWLSKGWSCMPFLSCLGTNWLKALLFLCEGKSDIAEHGSWLNYFPFLLYKLYCFTLVFVFSKFILSISFFLILNFSYFWEIKENSSWHFYIRLCRTRAFYLSHMKSQSNPFIKFLTLSWQLPWITITYTCLSPRDMHRNKNLIILFVISRLKCSEDKWVQMCFCLFCIYCF